MIRTVKSGVEANQRIIPRHNTETISREFEVFGVDSATMSSCTISAAPDSKMAVSYKANKDERYATISDTDGNANLQVAAGPYGDVTVRNPSKRRDGVVKFQKLIPRGSMSSFKRALAEIKRHGDNIKELTIGNEPGYWNENKWEIRTESGEYQEWLYRA